MDGWPSMESRNQGQVRHPSSKVTNSPKNSRGIKKWKWKTDNVEKCKTVSSNGKSWILSCGNGLCECSFERNASSQMIFLIQIWCQKGCWLQKF